MRFAGWVVFVLLAVACGGTTPEAAPPPSAPTPDAPRTPKPATDDDEPAATDECPEGMTRVAGGALFLGSPEGQGDANERPEHEVKVADFCLDLREVSVADFGACVQNAICEPLPTDARSMDKKSDSDVKAMSQACSARQSDGQLPATCVSADDAERYCRWKGHRLPSEAEWEMAATGGADRLAFPWGSTPPSDDKLCWLKKRACHVGSAAKEAFGLYDMAGNVSEWTESTWVQYPAASQKGGSRLVIRGGNYTSSKPEQVRPEARQPRFRETREPTLGFRCAKSL